jgi:translation initiation factor 3 subunit M
MQCENEEVEQWVIRTVTAGLVDCKMNQSARTVVFARAVQREFTSDHWQSCSVKLRTWVGQINSMLKSLNVASGGGAGGAPVGGGGGAAATAPL